MNKITLYPNAKVNLGLHITEKRADGYHNLETIFLPVSLVDKLEVAIADPSASGTTLSMGGSFIVEDHSEDNLVVKAYHLLAQDFSLPYVEIRLEKEIPMGAGLGGGSADCAFMIRALNELLELQLSYEKMEQYATKLGADCAFFIRNKAMYATGKGDIFQSLPALPLQGYHIVLVNPHIHITTKTAFSGVVPHPSSIDLREAVQAPITDWKNLIKNDFEESVFRSYPLVKEIKERLYSMGASYASMSGSGSTVYGIFPASRSEKELTTVFPHYFTMCCRCL